MPPKTSPKFMSSLITAATIGPFMRALWAMKRGHFPAPTRPRRRKAAA